MNHTPSPFDPIPLERDRARATVLPYGAQLTSWTTADGEEQLYLSAASADAYATGTAIRGGVPVIFPQFSTEGPLPRHGFARTRAWEVVDRDADRVALALRDDATTRALWPHPFRAELTVALGGGAIEVALRVENRGDDALAFTAALHTYLRVDDVAAAAIDGLAGVAFRDQTAGGPTRGGEPNPLRVAGEVDRVYVDVPGPVTVRDARRARRVDAEGFPDVVVWNPGAERAAALADVEPGGWRRFVCVEAAAIARPVSLAAGAEWRGAQRISR